MWRRKNSPCECTDCRSEHLQEQLNTQQSKIEALWSSNFHLIRQIQEHEAKKNEELVVILRAISRQDTHIKSLRC